MDLSNYVRVATYDLPEPTRTSAPANNLLAQEASGVTYNWDTNTLFIVGDGGTSVTQVSLTGQYIDTMTLPPGSSPQGTEFYDTEGITYIGNGKFVFTEERYRQVVEFTYESGGTLTRAEAHTVDLGTDIGNVGLEGLSYDPLSGGFIVVKEKDPESIFQTTIDFNAGTASNGSATTVASTNLLDPALVGTSDLSDVYALSSNAAFVGTALESHLLILSQETGRIVEIGRDGTVYSSLNLVAPSTPSGIDLAAMTVEGITMDANGRIYLVSEEGGGDANHPQLWVYEPQAIGPNLAPTAVSLSNPLASILENSNTAARIKVGDIAISDDGQGTNHITLSGADAASFEADSSGLYLKAGTALNYEAKQSYSVTVNVDDTTVGSTPDASTNYTLKVGNIVNEGAAGSVAITEVAPWSSSSAVGADWFELTNTGSTAINLAGWKMDDNSYAFASAVAMGGVSSLAAGQSAIFVEGTAATAQAFINTWFGGTAPAGVQVGYYSGSGVGLGTSGDAVNVFDGSGTLKASVTFGASPTGPFATFDNTAQLNSTSLTSHVTISTLSAVGTNGAFVAAGDAAEIGSPGSAGGVPAPVNQAPTAIGLTGEITTLADDTSTAAHVKVASIIVNDDGLGTNSLSLNGADASFFEVDATGLYLKAGTDLDAAAKSHYDVTVNVDDTTVGSTPDASVSFSLTLTQSATVRITEVAPWSSGNSPVAADWFELTNTGATAANISGWKVDDSSFSFANALALNGVSSIAAGESVIFVEGSAATAQAFINTWFGGTAPAGFQIGYYSGSGIGLSTGGDGVIIYDATGTQQAKVSFGSSPTGPFATFDNSAGLDNVALTQLSTAGVNGAFHPAADAAETGSPGTIVQPAPVNHAPTAIDLTGEITSLSDDTSTIVRVKVADIAISDDGLGTNSLSLGGADAASFEVDSTGLYIKAGIDLDAATKSHYDVTVTVDDTTVGSTPDASINFALDLTDAATVRITEVAPWSSSNSPVAADWFELTNTGATAANISGWKVDDSSSSFASALALNGVGSIAAGESVIFVEGSAATAQAFINTWFGGTAPAGFQVGWYSGSGIGLSTSGDGVVIYDATGTQQAKVSFGASPSGPFPTFDNSAGLDNVTLTQLSMAGVNGAFHPTADPAETGSPGTTVNPPNHDPVASNDTGSALSEDSVLTAAGNVITNDGDADNDLLAVAGARAGTEAAGGAFATVAGATIVHGLYGDLTITSDGSYSYALANNGAAVQALNAGEHVSDVFTYQSADTHGAIDLAELSFDITGADEGIIGTAANDTLNGTSDADILKGLAGNDRLNGGDGDDVLEGGLGADTLGGGAGIDTASYAHATSGVAVDLSSSKGTYGEATGDKLTLIENLTGSAFADVLEGNAKANVIHGGGGDDIIMSHGGLDDLFGDAGNDAFVITGATIGSIDGGDGFDTIRADGDNSVIKWGAFSHIEAISGDGYASVTIAGAGTNTADVIDLTGIALTDIAAINAGQGDDIVTGSAGADHINGLGGKDILDGGAGADFISGGAGIDLLSGGADADFFIFLKGDTGNKIDTADAILDFNHASGDIIDLSAFDAISTNGNGVDPFSFIGTSAFTKVAGQLHYEVSGSDAVLSGDLNGDGKADFVIKLAGVTHLVVDDFLL